MRIKWLALLLAGMMCAAALPGLAEGTEPFDAERVAPLLDAIATAALGADEATVLLEEETPLTEAFLARLTQALQHGGLDAGALSSLVAMPVTASATGADAAEPLTMQVLTQSVSGDGDAAMLVGEAVRADGTATGLRAVIELRREDASPVGWKLYRFTVGDTALEEELLEGYIAQTMMEYMNAACGYSIQYPAIFTEDTIVETATGIQAALPDESASFAVSRIDNAEGLTLEGLLQRGLPQAWINEATGSVQSRETDEAGVVHVAVFLVSESYIYQAELNFPQDQAGEYETYADYMTNSFSADELGNG